MTEEQIDELVDFVKKKAFEYLEDDFQLEEIEQWIREYFDQ